MELSTYDREEATSLLLFAAFSMNLSAFAAIVGGSLNETNLSYFADLNETNFVAKSELKSLWRSRERIRFHAAQYNSLARRYTRSMKLI